MDEEKKKYKNYEDFLNRHAMRATLDEKNNTESILGRTPNHVPFQMLYRMTSEFAELLGWNKIDAISHVVLNDINIQPWFVGKALANLYDDDFLNNLRAETGITNDELQAVKAYFIFLLSLPEEWVMWPDDEDE
jgi:hypothetical protein